MRETSIVNMVAKVKFAAIMPTGFWREGVSFELDS